MVRPDGRPPPTFEPPDFWVVLKGFTSEVGMRTLSGGSITSVITARSIYLRSLPPAAGRASALLSPACLPGQNRASSTTSRAKTGPRPQVTDRERAPLLQVF